jgi:hypothetical protein
MGGGGVEELESALRIRESANRIETNYAVEYSSRDSSMEARLDLRGAVANSTGSDRHPRAPLEVQLEAREFFERRCTVGVGEKDDAPGGVHDPCPHGVSLTPVLREADEPNPLVLDLYATNDFASAVGRPVVNHDDFGASRVPIEKRPQARKGGRKASCLVVCRDYDGEGDWIAHMKL